MRYFLLYVAVLVLLVNVFGCAAYTIIAFHSTANTQLKELSDSLTNTRLEDLFRQYPTLRLVKSTDIGNGNMRHEFTYLVIEPEDTEKRGAGVNAVYEYERRIMYLINMFVNAEGVIYEILTPIRDKTIDVMSDRKYDRWQKNPNKNVRPMGGKTRSLPYP